MTTAAIPQRSPVGRTVTAVLTCLGGAAAAALVWAQFRSYDMLDGAFYYQLFKDPADYSDTQTRFHLVARPVWLLCGQNIVAFRVATLALASIACWFFWRAWIRLLAPSGSSALYWWPLWLATIAGVTWVPVALTYNSLANIFALLGFGILLNLPAPPNAAPAGHRLPWLKIVLLAGIFYGAYLAKAPAAAALAACGFVLLCVEPHLNSRLRLALTLTGIVIAAAIVGAVLLVVTRPGFDPTSRINFNGLVFSPAWAEGTVRRYLAEIARLLPALRGDFAWTIGPAVIACAAALCGAHAAPTMRRWLAASLALVLLAAAWPMIARGLWDGSFAVAVDGNAARFYLLLWGSLLPIWIVCLLPGRHAAPAATIQQAAWILVLFVLPLISSFGSTNALYVCALHHTVFWAAGLLLLADQVAGAFAAPWFRQGVAVMLFAGAAGHIFTGHFLRPYMYQPSLWKQTESIEIGFPATKLKIDPALAIFLRQVRATLDANGYKPGDDVFGFFNLPGVIFAIGAKEPGAPWFFGTWYQNDETDGVKIYPVPLKRRQEAWIISQDDLTQFRYQLHYFSINFPEAYTRVGRTINPVSGLEVGIWKPRGRP